MKESNMRKGLRECWQARFEIRVGKATNMQWHLSRAWVETELRRRGEEEIWAEGPVWSDEWGARGYEEQWKVVHAGCYRGSEREIGRNVGNEVRPSDLVIHDENFQWHCKWEMTGEVCGAGLCRQGLMECLSEEVRGSWVRRQVSRRAGGVFQEGVSQCTVLMQGRAWSTGEMERPVRLQEEEEEDRRGDTEHAGTTPCSWCISSSDW